MVLHCALNVINASIETWCALTGKLLITDSLLVYGGDEWINLHNDGNVVDASLCTWPSRALLQFRVNAMNATKDDRRIEREGSPFFCHLCCNSYVTLNGLLKHYLKCICIARPISTFTVPSENIDYDGEGDSDDSDHGADEESEPQQKMGPG